MISHGVPAVSASDGVASSRRRVEPQRGTTQSGASRSVSPDMLRRERRL